MHGAWSLPPHPLPGSRANRGPRRGCRIRRRPRWSGTRVRELKRRPPWLSALGAGGSVPRRRPGRHLARPGPPCQAHLVRPVSFAHSASPHFWSSPRPPDEGREDSYSHERPAAPRRAPSAAAARHAATARPKHTRLAHRDRTAACQLLVVIGSQRRTHFRRYRSRTTHHGPLRWACS